MRPITQEDLNKIQSYAGQTPNDTTYKELTTIYSKLDYLCKAICKHGFDYTIRQDPRKVAGSNITYREYQWAKIYPRGMKASCKDYFAYVVGLSDSLHFHMMGVGEYQSHSLSTKASNACWTEFDVENFNYEEVAKKFVEFDKRYRKLFINTGVGFGISECIKKKKELFMEELINLLLQKGQIVLQGPPGTGKTYTAKDIAEKLIFDSVSTDKKNQKTKLDESGQFKLVQFHPSYTYEDFVRGIEAQGTEIGIEYKAVEKQLSLFARKATENWVNHFSTPIEVHRRNWINEKLNSFIEHFSQEFANSTNGRISLTGSVYITQIDDDCFRYQGDAWAKPSRINYSDLRNIIEINLAAPDNPIIPVTISRHAFHRSSYYSAVLKRFFDYSGHYESAETEREELKNFVLIIDELNRANLPSVLGELIYALEYRGENIETVYEIDGNKTIQLPKNLYIIGTMNTADRSVGHIDYAIRRRFAFVDILPTDEPINTSEGKELFKKISELFIRVENGRIQSSEHLSSDFNFKEVQIGHSYFICDIDKLPFRLEYELKPILREYLKDGILMSSAEKLIESL